LETLEPWVSKPCMCCGCASWYHDYRYAGPRAFTSGCSGCDGCAGYEPWEKGEDLVCNPVLQSEMIKEAERIRHKFKKDNPEIWASLKQHALQMIDKYGDDYIEEKYGLTRQDLEQG